MIIKLGRYWPRLAVWVLALCLLAPMVIWASITLDRSGPIGQQQPIDPSALRPGYGPKTFEEALQRADSRLAVKRECVLYFPSDWLYLEGLSHALLSRARLVGDTRDLVEADQVLAHAIAISPWPAGPALSRASEALYLHKLDLSQSALRRLYASVMTPEIEDLDEARSMECEIAFQRGRLSEAANLCAVGDNLGIRLRRANLYAKQGQTARAMAQIDTVLRAKKYSPSTLSAIELQRASVALARGDWQASGRWVRAANRAFPGSWLTESYLAQQFALEGNLEEARKRYEVLAMQTGNPDVMDGLTRVLEAKGLVPVASHWRDAATRVWQLRVAALPEAYSTHYAEHMLAYGDPVRALALAEREYARRPFSTTIVNYARALNRNGMPDKALNVLQDGFKAGFYTPAMLSAESVSFSDLGRPFEARIAMFSAKLLNPKIEDPRQKLVVFDQD